MYMSKKKRLHTICLIVLLALTLMLPTNAEAATKVKLNKTKIMLTVGKTATLKLKGAKVKKWSSSNKKVATVSSKGKVKAKKEGTATIKVKATNGKNYKCKVTVKEVEKNENSSVNYSANDVVNVIESTLRAAGFNKTTDVMTAEEIAEWGPTAGAGWGEGHCTLDGAVAEAESMIVFMNIRGYNTFYIEALGISNDGVVTYRFYRCTI